jgi:hypothetical protein
VVVHPAVKAAPLGGSSFVLTDRPASRRETDSAVGESLRVDATGIGILPPPLRNYNSGCIVVNRKFNHRFINYIIPTPSGLSDASPSAESEGQESSVFIMTFCAVTVRGSLTPLTWSDPQNQAYLSTHYYHSRPLPNFVGVLTIIEHPAKLIDAFCSESTEPLALLESRRVGSEPRSPLFLDGEQPDWRKGLAEV